MPETTTAEVTPRLVDINDATPRPWRRSCFLIQGLRGDWVTHTGMGNLPPSRSHESEANAELIVTAVNSFAATQKQLAALREALREAQAVIEDMRSENKLHGHITDASANYLHKVKPQIDSLLSGEES